MSLKARIASCALVIALLALLGGYYFSYKDLQSYDEDYKYIHMDGQSLIVAELWESLGGCEETRQPDFDGFTEDFFGFTGLAYRIECKDNEYAAESAVFPQFENPIPDDADYYESIPDLDGDDCSGSISLCYLQSTTNRGNPLVHGTDA